jgi:hypothetical protein
VCTATPTTPATQIPLSSSTIPRRVARPTRKAPPTRHPKPPPHHTISNPTNTRWQQRKSAGRRPIHSPHAGVCSGDRQLSVPQWRPFPARGGVPGSVPQMAGFAVSVPARGGVPDGPTAPPRPGTSVPRTRGCALSSSPAASSRIVRSPHAGVCLGDVWQVVWSARLFPARGGVPRWLSAHTGVCPLSVAQTASPTIRSPHTGVCLTSTHRSGAVPYPLLRTRECAALVATIDRTPGPLPVCGGAPGNTRTVALCGLSTPGTQARDSESRLARSSYAPAPRRSTDRVPPRSGSDPTRPKQTDPILASNSQHLQVRKYPFPVRGGAPSRTR